MKIDAIMDKIELVLKRDYQTTLLDATPQQLHDALGAVVMGGARPEDVKRATAAFRAAADAV